LSLASLDSFCLPLKSVSTIYNEKEAVWLVASEIILKINWGEAIYLTPFIPLSLSKERGK